MVIPYLLLFGTVLLDLYLLFELLWMRSKGDIIYGKIVGKKYYSDEGVKHYYDIIEYKTSTGRPGTTRAKIKQKDKERGFGKTVKLYEYSKGGKTQVKHPTIYLHKLYGSLLFTIILIGYIIVANT